MNKQRFLPTEIFPTLFTFKLLDVAVCLHVSRVMCFRVHCETADFALESLDSEVNNVQMIKHMSFMLEFESTSVTCEWLHVIVYQLRLMSCLLVIGTLGACVKLLEAIRAVEVCCSSTGFRPCLLVELHQRLPTNRFRIRHLRCLFRSEFHFK